MTTSIIIPVYNKEAYVKQAVESALNQIDSDIEVIAIDDGSIDRSLPVLQSIKDNRLQVFTQTNRGVSVTRNRAIGTATGQFYIPLDADDWLESDFVKETTQHIYSEAVGVVVTAEWLEPSHRIQMAPLTTLKEELSRNCLPSCALYRKAAWLEIPGGYKTEVSPFEDWNMWVDILKRGWFISYFPKPLFHYRQLPVSALTGTSRPSSEELHRRILNLHPDLLDLL